MTFRHTFFLTRVTLIGSGVDARSSSTSYCGNAEGKGIAGVEKPDGTGEGLDDVNGDSDGLAP